MARPRSTTQPRKSTSSTTAKAKGKEAATPAAPSKKRTRASRSPSSGVETASAVGSVAEEGEGEGEEEDEDGDEGEEEEGEEEAGKAGGSGTGGGGEKGEGDVKAVIVPYKDVYDNLPFNAPLPFCVGKERCSRCVRKGLVCHRFGLSKKCLNCWAGGVKADTCEHTERPVKVWVDAPPSHVKFTEPTVQKASDAVRPLLPDRCLKDGVKCFDIPAPNLAKKKNKIKRLPDTVRADPSFDPNKADYETLDYDSVASGSSNTGGSPDLEAVDEEDGDAYKMGARHARTEDCRVWSAKEAVVQAAAADAYDVLKTCADDISPEDGAAVVDYLNSVASYWSLRPRTAAQGEEGGEEGRLTDDEDEDEDEGESVDEADETETEASMTDPSWFDGYGGQRTLEQLFVNKYKKSSSEAWSGLKVDTRSLPADLKSELEKLAAASRKAWAELGIMVSKTV